MYSIFIISNYLHETSEEASNNLHKSFLHEDEPISPILHKDFNDHKLDKMEELLANMT
jgi:hypothetical protein